MKHDRHARIQETVGQREHVPIGQPHVEDGDIETVAGDGKAVGDAVHQRDTGATLLEFGLNVEGNHEFVFCKQNVPTAKTDRRVACGLSYGMPCHDALIPQCVCGILMTIRLLART